MIQYTPEQNEVIYSDKKFQYVSSGAGTGKTTTLEGVARARRHENILYLVYNSRNKEEAKKKMPINVTVETAHSLAYKIIGRQYQHKLKNNLKAEDIISFFQWNISNQEDFEKAFKIKTAIEYFLNSDLENILEINSQYKNEIKAFWHSMVSIVKDTAPMIQDGYLKLFQLSNPTLFFDLIVIDEAQDLNQTIVDIINKQTCPKIFVGDIHQKIYGYRNTVDILSNKEVTYLSHSFRFGEPVAKLATKLIKTFSDDSFILHGNKERDTKIVDHISDEPYTMICRTNAEVLIQAIEAINRQKTIHIIGDLDDLINLIKDIFYLKNNKLDQIVDDKIRAFGSMKKLKGVAENLKIAELNSALKIIDKYQDATIDVIQTVKEQNFGIRMADISFITAHKSKGLEFVNVRIAEDFVNLFDKSGKLAKADIEEINILYVALTRATHALWPNKDLKKLL